MSTDLSWPSFDRFSGSLCRAIRVRWCLRIEALERRSGVHRHVLVRWERRSLDVVSEDVRWRLYKALRDLVLAAARAVVAQLDALPHMDKVPELGPPPAAGSEAIPSFLRMIAAGA